MMIIGIQLPEGATLKQTSDGKVLFIFDERKTKSDFSKVSSSIWVTEGNSEEDFFENKALDVKQLTLSYRNKLKMSSM